MTRLPAMKTRFSTTAEPPLIFAERSPSAAFSLPLLLLISLLPFVLISLLLALPAFADPTPDDVTRMLSREDPSAFQIQPLDDLLALPIGVSVWEQLTTDESLAAAVGLGNDPSLEPRNPFQKRSTDIFRTQRWVQVGQRDLLLRLRVRAKSTNTMSVEVKF